MGDKKGKVVDWRQKVKEKKSEMEGKINKVFFYFASSFISQVKRLFELGGTACR